MPSWSDPGRPGGSSPGGGGSDSDRISYVGEAFKWQYNLIGLGAAAAVAALSLSALPLVLAAGLELVYLSTIPHNSRFQRLVRSWKYAEEKRAREAKLGSVLRELIPPLRSRYAALDQVCRAIRANYARLSSTSQIFVSQTDSNLQGLLQAYLRLLWSAQQHGEYMRNSSPNAIREEVTQLQEGLESDVPKVQEINKKRIEILTKRLEKFDKIKENRQVIDAQCAALEDVLQLIRDQSVTITDPQQISGQLENLMHDVEQTEQTVRQVEAIFEMTAPDSPDALAPLPAGPVGAPASPAPPQREKN
jgi:hypothetical protein